MLALRATPARAVDTVGDGVLSSFRLLATPARAVDTVRAPVLALRATPARAVDTVGDGVLSGLRLVATRARAVDTARDAVLIDNADIPTRSTAVDYIYSLGSKGAGILSFPGIAIEIDPLLVEGNAVAWLRDFTVNQTLGNNWIVSLRTGAAADSSPGLVGPELISTWETLHDAIVLEGERDNGTVDTVTIPGPDSAEAVARDADEPYSWTVSTDLDDFVNTAYDDVRIIFSSGIPLAYVASRARTRDNADTARLAPVLHAAAARAVDTASAAELLPPNLLEATPARAADTASAAELLPPNQLEATPARASDGAADARLVAALDTTPARAVDTVLNSVLLDNRLQVLRPARAVDTARDGVLLLRATPARTVDTARDGVLALRATPARTVDTARDGVLASCAPPRRGRWIPPPTRSCYRSPSCSPGQRKRWIAELLPFAFLLARPAQAVDGAMAPRLAPVLHARLVRAVDTVGTPHFFGQGVVRAITGPSFLGLAYGANVQVFAETDQAAADSLNLQTVASTGGAQRWRLRVEFEPTVPVMGAPTAHRLRAHRFKMGVRRVFEFPMPQPFLRTSVPARPAGRRRQGRQPCRRVAGAADPRRDLHRL